MLARSASAKSNIAMTASYSSSLLNTGRFQGIADDEFLAPKQNDSRLNTQVIWGTMCIHVPPWSCRGKLQGGTGNRAVEGSSEKAHSTMKSTSACASLSSNILSLTLIQTLDASFIVSLWGVKEYKFFVHEPSTNAVWVQNQLSGFFQQIFY